MGAVTLTAYEQRKIAETLPDADVLEAYGQSDYNVAVKRQKQIAGRNYRGVESVWGEHRQLYLVIRP